MERQREIRICSKHGETEFALEKSGRCLKCQVEATQKRRNKVKEMAVEYKGGKCSVCGYDRCADALEFHHLDPSKRILEYLLKDIPGLGIK